MYSFEQLSYFYKDKKVLITGHTGFKGSWLCRVLTKMGAKVAGFALEPPTDPSIFDILKIGDSISSYIGDIRDLKALKDVFEKECPEIVIHMAAQPLVRESYSNPVGTYETNVMGTVNVLECCRNTKSVRSVVNVTTDKVYRNNEWEKGYVETDYLDGYDPYSNSKSCSELVTHSYIQSFFNPESCKENSVDELGPARISTCRAGNVIGGGDFATDRIIPDCFRAAANMEDIIVRNPYSTRPYEHVLEPLFAYLMVAKEQFEDRKFMGNYNVGPDDESNVNTGNLTDMFCEKWNDLRLSDCEGSPRPLMKWINRHDGGPHEAGFLKLNCDKLKKTFGWHPVWNINTTMDKLVEWYSVYLNKGDIEACTDSQIEEFINSGR